MDRNSLFLRDPSTANMIVEAPWIVAVCFYRDPSLPGFVNCSAGRFLWDKDEQDGGLFSLLSRWRDHGRTSC